VGEFAGQRSKEMALPFKITVTVIYCLLLLWISLSIFIVWRGGHKVKSFEFAFFWMCLLWSVLRSVFWFSTLGLYDLSDEGDWTLLVSFWLPTPLQFSVFSLLTLFYASVALGKRDWRTKRPRLVALYAALNVPLLVTALTLAGLAGTSNRLSSLQNLFLAFAGSLFLVLAILLFFSAAVLARLESYQAMNVFQFDRRTMAVVNVLLAMVFLSRGIFNLLSSANKVELTVALNGSADLSWWGFVLYVLWEFVPTVLLLATIARPPSTALLFRRGSHAAETAPGPLLMFDGVDASGTVTTTQASGDERYRPLDGHVSYGGAGDYSPAGFDSGSYRLDSSDGDGLSDASRTPPEGYLRDGAQHDAPFPGAAGADAMQRSRHEAWARGATRYDSDNEDDMEGGVGAGALPYGTTGLHGAAMGASCSPAVGFIPAPTHMQSDRGVPGQQDAHHAAETFGTSTSTNSLRGKQSL